MISLITCTGFRQEAFSLLEQYVKSNKYLTNYEWIVVCDGKEDTVCTMGQKFLKGPRVWEEGYNTQRGNLELALEHVKGDLIFIPEDDEWYSPTYFNTLQQALAWCKVVGISNSRYYKVDFPGWKTMKNFEHASLSQTAFHRDLLPIMKKAVNSGEFYFDIAFWREVHKQNIPFTLIANTNLSIGMKGLPGRAGLTPSHRDNKGYMMDADFAKLKEWLGVSWKNYEPWLKKRVSLKSSSLTPIKTTQMSLKP